MDFNFDFGFETESNKEQQPQNINGGFGGFDFGQSLESFFEVTKKETKKTDKSKAENSAKKKSIKKESKKTSSSGKDMDVKLPLKVVGRGFETTVAIEEKETFKLSEIIKKLIENGYEQFKVAGMGLKYIEVLNTAFVSFNGTASPDDTVVELADEKNITVIDGQFSSTFSLDDFDGKEEDEISLADVKNKFEVIHPSYKGCSLCYDDDSGYCYPVFKQSNENKIESPVTIFWRGESIEVEDVESFKDVTKKIFGNLPSEVFVSYGEMENGSYAVNISCYNAYSEKSASSSKQKKVEQKYNLPLELYIVTFNCSYNLTSDDFGGKEKVTFEEIKKHMATKQKMFADNSRKLDSLYNDEMNRLAVMFISGSKGCEMIRTRADLENIKKKNQFHGFFVDANESFRIMVLPHGNFISHVEPGREYEVARVTFERKLPKIPKILLESIISYFREDLNEERMIRISFNKETGVFSFYKAGGVKGRAYMAYEFDSLAELMSPNMIQVMEIHSHNTMPAFFSSIDDKDESGYPGVFGVIGNLDQDEPSMLFRAGIDGCFSKVEVTELFEI